jgi:hypothetical protein
MGTVFDWERVLAKIQVELKKHMEGLAELGNKST